MDAGVVGPPYPPTPQCIDSPQTHMQHGRARSLCWTQSLCVNLSVALTTKQWSPKQSADTSPAAPAPPLGGPGTHGCIYTPADNVSADHSVEHCDTQLTSLGRSNAGCSMTRSFQKSACNKGAVIGLEFRQTGTFVHQLHSEKVNKWRILNMLDHCPM